MQTSKLGIYVDLTHLLEKYYPAMFQMNKKDRVILGDKILDAILDCIGHTAMANSCTDERIMHINAMIGRFEHVKALLRFGIDSGILQERFRLPMFEYVARIDESVVRWRTYTLSRQQSRPNGHGESVDR